MGYNISRKNTRIVFIWDLHLSKEIWIDKQDSLQYSIYKLARNNDVSLIYKSKNIKNDSFVYAGVDFIALNNTQTIYEKTKQIKPDIIVVNSIDANYFPIINKINGLSCRKVLVDSGGAVWNNFPGGYDGIAVVRNCQKGYVDHENVHVIPYGANTRIFKPLNLKKEWDVICVADDRPVKRIDVLASIMNKTELNMIVNGYSNKSGQVGKVFYDGRETSPVKLSMNINRARIASLVSYPRDTGPRSVSETLSCGLPHVTSDYSQGIASLVEEADAGIVVSDSELEDAFLSLIADEELMKKFGKNAREFAEKNLSFEKIHEKYKKLFFGT